MTVRQKMLSITKIALGSDHAEYFSISSVERFSDGSGWCEILTVRSAPFALVGHKFYFDNLLEFRDRICSIYKNLEGSAILRPRYEQDYLEVTATTRGHISVNGHLELSPPRATGSTWSSFWIRHSCPA